MQKTNHLSKKSNIWSNGRENLVRFKEKINWKCVGIITLTLTVMVLFLMEPEVILAKDDIPEDTADIDSKDLDSTLGTIIKTIIRFLAGIAGIVLFGKLVIDGMKLMGSSGNPQTRSEAIHGIMWSLAGGIIAIGAYAFSGVIVGIVEDIL